MTFAQGLFEGQLGDKFLQLVACPRKNEAKICVT